MIYYEDNFLPQDQFLALKERVKKRFVPTDAKKLTAGSDEPVRLTYHDHTGNWQEGCNFLGQECRPAIEKIIFTMENKVKIQSLHNWSIWYQYIINAMTIPPHQDQGLRKSDQANTYTAIIYTSDWEPGWGGEFVVGEPVFPKSNNLSKPRATSITNFTHVVEPKPNRMLIWSREEWHAVNEVTSPDPNYIRSFFGTGWSSVDVLDMAMGERA